METTTAEPKTEMMAKPQEEHEWLQKFVGEWRFEGEVMMDPSQPPEKYSGTESVRSLGGLWIVGEGRGNLPNGEPAVWITQVGYDPAKGRFVGTFIMSMETNLWVYEGELDEDEDTLILYAEGPNMMSPGKMAKFQDATHFESDDHRILTSSIQGDDGEWRVMMTAHYWRKE